MEIQILMDNYVDKSHLCTEHGFSLMRILKIPRYFFDTILVNEYIGIDKDFL